jgi:hypothetical protein
MCKIIYKKKLKKKAEEQIGIENEEEKDDI